MAKRNQATSAPAQASGGGRCTASIDSAENGFIVHTGSEGSGKNAKYESRTFVAPNHTAAIRIAAAHIQGRGVKAKGKKGKKKVAASKR